MARTLHLALLTLLALLALPAAAFAAGHNITVSSGATAGVSSVTAAGTTTFTATADGAVLNTTDLNAALSANNVVVATGNTGNDSGDISMPGGFIMNSSITTTLDLQAANDVTITGQFNRGGVLKMEAGHDIALTDSSNQISSDGIDATATHAINLGTSVLTTGPQTWTGPANVAGGVTSSGDVTFTDNVVLTSGFGISGAVITMGGTIDGAHQFNVSGTKLNLSKDVGAGTPLSLFLAGSIPVATGGTLGTISATTISFGGLDITGTSNSAVQVNATTFNEFGAANLTGKALFVNGGGVISGVASGPAGALVKTGSGTLRLLSTNTYTGATTVSQGTLQVDGTTGTGLVFLASGTKLTGAGATTAVSSTGATISPGVSSTDTLTTAGLDLDSSSHVQIALTATGAGNFDQVAVSSGTINLNNAVLDLTATPALAAGSQFTIIDNQTAGPIGGAGTFLGLPEGALVTAGPNTFRISYVGGTGNDVVLTVHQPVAPTIQLTCGPEPLTEAAPGSCTVIARGPNGAPTPTGNVSFELDGSPLATLPLSNGSATLSFNGPSPGPHTFRVSYVGDANYTAGATTLDETVAARFVEQSGGTTTNPAPTPTPTGETVSPSVPVTIAVADAKAKAKKGKRSFITFVVTRSGSLDSTVNVQFATRNGTARAGKQFKALKGTLKFTAGVKQLTVKVVLLPPRGKPKRRRFSLVLAAPQGATLTRSVAIGTIS